MSLDWKIFARVRPPGIGDDWKLSPTWCSLQLSVERPPYDAELVQRLDFEPAVVFSGSSRAGDEEAEGIIETISMSCGGAVWCDHFENFPDPFSSFPTATHEFYWIEELAKAEHE